MTETSSGATPTPGKTRDQWESLIASQIAEGQYFLAFDLYREAITHHPDALRLRLQGALALLRGGALEEARTLLAPLKSRMETRRQRIRRDAAVLKAALKDPDNDDAIERALTCIQSSGYPGGQTGAGARELESPETLRLIVLIQTEIGVSLDQPEFYDHARDIAVDVFAMTRDPVDGMMAATLTAMSGDLEQARHIARQVRDNDRRGDDTEREFVRFHVTRGTAAIFLQDPDEATDAYRQVVEQSRRHYPTIVTILDRLELIGKAGLEIPAAVLACLKVPRTAVFAGQPMDRAMDRAIDRTIDRTDAPQGQTAPTTTVSNGEPDWIFPPEIESRVAAAIGEKLDRLDIEVGFCGASAGSDLLFIEAMLQRGREVHLFLPFALDDVVAHRIAYAGPTWERRFRNAMKLVNSVTYATEEPFLGHDVLLRYNNTLIEGAARVQSAMWRTEPHLMLVWDHAASNGPGTIADFMDGWPDITRLHLIDLDDLRPDRPSLPRPSPAKTISFLSRETPHPVGEQRVIRSMLFADMAGYSKLGDRELPDLWRSLGSISAGLEGYATLLRLIESWGDALYAVMDTATAMVDYAFAVLDGIARLGERSGGSGGPATTLQLRVALHAGPVYEGVNPLTGRPIVYGSQVSRAARIEPISLPGQIYASHQFVAMLLSEENASRHATEATGGTYVARYSCDYIGILSLAKNYGRQQIYRIRRLG